MSSCFMVPGIYLRSDICECAGCLCVVLAIAFFIFMGDDREQRWGGKKKKEKTNATCKRAPLLTGHHIRDSCISAYLFLRSHTHAGKGLYQRRWFFSSNQAFDALSPHETQKKGQMEEEKKNIQGGIGKGLSDSCYQLPSFQPNHWYR